MCCIEQKKMDNSVVLLQYGFFSLFGAGQFLVEGLVVENDTASKGNPETTNLTTADDGDGEKIRAFVGLGIGLFLLVITIAAVISAARRMKNTRMTQGTRTMMYSITLTPDFIQTLSESMRQSVRNSTVDNMQGSIGNSTTESTRNHTRNSTTDSIESSGRGSMRDLLRSRRDLADHVWTLANPSLIPFYDDGFQTPVSVSPPPYERISDTLTSTEMTSSEMKSNPPSYDEIVNSIKDESDPPPYTEYDTADT